MSYKKIVSQNFAIKKTFRNFAKYKNKHHGNKSLRHRLPELQSA